MVVVVVVVVIVVVMVRSGLLGLLLLEVEYFVVRTVVAMVLVVGDGDGCTCHTDICTGVATTSHLRHAGQVVAQILLGEWRKKAVWQEQLRVLQRRIAKHHAALDWRHR